LGNIIFAEDAWEEYLYWQTQDKKTLKKINILLKEIQRMPFDGTGKPEPLKDSMNWSRRIDGKNRLVYEVQDGTVIVKQCRGHYDDK